MLATRPTKACGTTVRPHPHHGDQLHFLVDSLIMSRGPSVRVGCIHVS